MDINNLVNDSFKSEEQPKQNSKLKSVRLFLLNLLMKLTPINFSLEAGLIGKDKLGLKHYLVLTVKNLLQFAESNNWSLCSNHGQSYFYNGQYWEFVEKDDLQWFLGEGGDSGETDHS